MVIYPRYVRYINTHSFIHSFIRWIALFTLWTTAPRCRGKREKFEGYRREENRKEDGSKVQITLSRYNTYGSDSSQICLGPLWDTRTQVSQDWTSTDENTCSCRWHSCLWRLREQQAHHVKHTDITSQQKLECFFDLYICHFQDQNTISPYWPTIITIYFFWW